MKRFVVREDSSGEILRTGSCLPEDVIKQAATGTTAEEDTVGVQDDTHYYDGSAYVDRPSLGLVYTTLNINTSETLVITGIPSGTTVYYPGGSEVVNDGEITWNTVVSGVFEFSFENFPYIKEALNVTVADI